jgi:hypothetical protein
MAYNVRHSVKSLTNRSGNPQQYSAAEMERMMKVQDVLLKAMAKKITW